MLIEIEPPYFIVKPGVTEEEFYALGEDSNWEFLDGRLVLATASNRHEDLFGFLGTLLRSDLDERGGGVVLGSRYPMRLDERWSPEPDLLVVRDENRHRLTEKYLDGPGDLVIEIVSEGDPKLELREKLPRYQEAGIPEIWIVDPFEQVVRVVRASAGGYTTETLASGRLASAVLPGFWIEVDWLWRPEMPSTLACVREILG